MLPAYCCLYGQTWAWAGSADVSTHDYRTSDCTLIQAINKFHLPVFPLNTVVFVNASLQLQIFEQRYIDMVKECMRNQHGFVSVLIKKGREVDDTPEIYEVGSYVEIIDWDRLQNNLLGITIKAQQRVRLVNKKIDENKLMSADIACIENLKASEHDVFDEELTSLLGLLSQHPYVREKYPEFEQTDVVDAAYKLCELLPISNREKQTLLELDQPRLLIDQLKSCVKQLEG